MIPTMILTTTQPGFDPGIGEKSSFFPIYLLGIAPFVWGLLVSAVAGVVVSLMSPPPEQKMLERFFA